MASAPRPDLSTQRARSFGGSSRADRATVEKDLRPAFGAALQQRLGSAVGAQSAAAPRSVDLRAALAERVNERKEAGR